MSPFWMISLLQSALIFFAPEQTPRRSPNAFSLRCRKEPPVNPGHVRSSKENEHENPQNQCRRSLWRNSMLPEGILERWLVADGDTAHAGHAIAQVRIEGALHDI